MDPRIFDIELFQALNDEYAAKRVANPANSATEITSRAKRRVDRIDRLFDVTGKRVLDLGCGRGEVAHELASAWDCEVTGVDIEPYSSWRELDRPNLRFRQVDLSDRHDIPLRSFDVIYSYSVMEHVRRPLDMLRACRDLLAPAGRFLLVAHLYRSATGSHRAREVFFPWPHLLFTDDVFEEHYRRLSRKPLRPAWLNKLTYADYLQYFDMLGLTVEREFVRMRELDAAFYERFEDQLAAYSVFDLCANAVEVVLAKDPTAAPVDGSQRLLRRAAAEKRPIPARAIAALAPQPVPAWHYWGEDGALSAVWQCPRRGWLCAPQADSSSIRVAAESADPFYLSSSGGKFDAPPADPSIWRIAGNRVCSIAVDLAVEGDASVEMWVIEYGANTRLCHSRQPLQRGTTRLDWRTNPEATCVRLALRFAGAGAAILGPIVFATEP